MAEIPGSRFAGASSSNSPGDDAVEEVDPVASGLADDDGEMTDGSSFPGHLSEFAPFQGIPRMPMGPENSLRNPKVGIPLVEGALLHGDWAALSTDTTPLSQLAQDVLANTARVSSCPYLHLC